MIDYDLVFDSVRRGYNELEESSNSEILDYFQDLDTSVMDGHISNIKGILFEQVYTEQLLEQGVQAEMFDLVNHPDVDIAIFEGEEIVSELQLKATDSVSYVNEAFTESVDGVVVTTEVASQIGSDMVIDSGIENALLERAVTETLVEEAVNPLSPISVLGWFFGLPF